MYRPQQAFAFDQETGYAETATDSLPAHGKKNTAVSGDTEETQHFTMCLETLGPRPTHFSILPL